MKIQPIEILESRIAPAVIFFSGTEFTAKIANGDPNGQVVDTDGDANDITVRLKAGDSVILDSNGNLVRDEGEIELVKITGGRAVIYAVDTGDAGFSNGDLTGVSVGNGFKGTIRSIISGSVKTTLNVLGDDTGNIQAGSSINGLVADEITGDIIAGGNISNIIIGKDIPLPVGSSVRDITANGSIKNVTLYHGGGKHFGWRWS